LALGETSNAAILRCDSPQVLTYRACLTFASSPIARFLKLHGISYSKSRVFRTLTSPIKGLALFWLKTFLAKI
jgi:hypothetical protein